MSRIQEIYEKLYVEGKTLQIPFYDRNAYNVLRIAIHKKHKMMTDSFPDQPSLLSRFDPTTKIGTFKFGPKKVVVYTILGEDVPASVPETLPTGSSHELTDDEIDNLPDSAFGFHSEAEKV